VKKKRCGRELKEQINGYFKMRSHGYFFNLNFRFNKEINNFKQASQQRNQEFWGEAEQGLILPKLDAVESSW